MIYKYPKLRGKYFTYFLPFHIQLQNHLCTLWKFHTILVSMLIIIIGHIYKSFHNYDCLIKISNKS